MSSAYAEAGLGELLGTQASCFAGTAGHGEYPGVMKDVSIFSPCGQKYLVFKNLVMPLGRKVRTVLGSDPVACDMVLVGEGIDARHATIFYHDGAYFIEDHDSRNGTFVNNRRVAPVAELHVGDMIRLKSYVMRFTGVNPD